MIITLKNLKDATAQQVFDQVAIHLRTQKVQSKKPDPDSLSGNSNMCAYRGGNGLKCAAGALIADDEFVPEMDMADEGGVGTSWHCLIKRKLVESTQHDVLIAALQAVHDSDYTPFEKGLETTAARHNLQYTPV